VNCIPREVLGKLDPELSLNSPQSRQRRVTIKEVHHSLRNTIREEKSPKIMPGLNGLSGSHIGNGYLHLPRENAFCCEHEPM